MRCSTLEEIRAAPKVLLHDHLDGGLRPQTVLELAHEIGYADLPGDNVEELTRRRPRARTALTWRSMDAFRHTVAVMQTADALRRVAAECVEDLAADGVVYAEVRFAPELHTERGLSLDEVVEAVLDGLPRAAAQRAARIKVDALLTAMRTAARSWRSPSWRSATATTAWSASTSRAPRWAGRRACTWTRSSTSSARTSASRSTRARAFGLASISEAVQWCGTERLGHGVRIVEDIEIGPEGERPPRPAGGVHQGPADPAGDVPDLEPADRRRAVDRASTRSSCCASSSSASRSTATTG